MMFFCEGDTMSNYTVVVSDSRVLLVILKSFVKLNLIPNVFQDGNKINFLEIPSLKIRFVHIGCYTKGSIFDLATQFGISFERKYFPNSWNKTQFYNYVGTPPPLVDFYQFSDSNAERIEKSKFWLTLNLEWSFKENLLLTLQYETKIFVMCCLSFLTQCFELQDLIANELQLKTEEIHFIHPFGWKISSISGFTSAVFSYFFMNNYEMYSVMQPFTGNSVQISRGEYEWTNWLNWKHFGLNVLSAFNNGEGQKAFGKHFVDGYSAETKTVFQYRGCEVK
jgi:hypothetical protein